MIIKVDLFDEPLIQQKYCTVVVKKKINNATIPGRRELCFC